MKSSFRLDCEDTEAAYASIAALCGLRRSELHDKLDDFPEPHDSDRWEALAIWLNFPMGSFEVCWFHGTRTATSESFHDGIFPLLQVLDRIWKDLESLIADRVNPSQFAEIKKEVEMDNYGMGRIGRDVIESRMRQQGPYAFLIRDFAVRPTNRAMHHYSRVPELVDMILCSFPAPHSRELKRRYYEQTKPCIVKFVSEENDRRIVGCAADYLLHLQKGIPLEGFLSWNYDGNGRCVPGGNIMYSQYIVTSSSVFDPNWGIGTN